jgi:hypothetical protein
MTPQAQRRSKRKTVLRYVIERGGWYYFRRRIPAELIAIIGKEEFKEALGTTDLAEAKLLAERKTVETSDIIEIARRRVPPRILRPSSGSRAGKPAALDWMWS